MYLLLRADQRLKRNHEDVLLLAHLQELYLSVKELGPMLNQKIIRQSSIRTRNSLSPSSSMSFRTQSHRSFNTGQCFNSERFLRVHLSHRMCNQLTLHHEFRIDTRRTNFDQKTDGILHVCGSNEQGTQES